MMSDDERLPAELVAQATRRREGTAAFSIIVPKRTALLALNMQNAWLGDDAPFDRGGRSRAVLPRVNALAGALRRQGGRVVWLQTTTGGVGEADYWAGYFDHFVKSGLRETAVAALRAGSALHAMHPAAEVASEDIVLPKHRFSAFLRNPHDLETMLRGWGVDTVIVAGVASNVCCESTVRDAMMRDFRCFMPHDAVAAPDREAHLGALRSVMQVFADVRESAEVLALIGSSIIRPDG